MAQEHKKTNLNKKNAKNDVFKIDLKTNHKRIIK